jgi:hypothetical protein
MQRNRQQKSNLHRLNRMMSTVASIGNSTIPRPPRFISTFEFSKIVRYSFESTASFTLTRATLLDLLGMAISSTSIDRVAEAVKIKQLKVWGPPGVATGTTSYASNVVSLQWLSNLAKSETISESSMSIEPAFISSKPPRNSLAGFWSLSGENEDEEILTLIAPGSSIVDLHLSFVMEKEFPISITTSATGLTPGQTYLLTVVSSGENLVPVDYPTYTI